MIMFKWLLLWSSSMLTTANHWEVFSSSSKQSDHTYSYIQQRDVNLGGIFSIHEPGNGNNCGANIRDTGEVQYVEAMVYAIDQINKDPLLLGNLSLGYAIFDDCATPEFALGQAIHFLPLYPKDACKTCDEYPLKKNFFNVWGVLGAESSPSTIMVANILSHFHIPVISPFATGDALSDKTRFPYFLRMVPPDHYQVQAIFALLKHFKWSYISILHSKGEYGEGACTKLKEMVSSIGVCVATSSVVTQDHKANEYEALIQRLYKLGSRVVVLFTDQEETRQIFHWVLKLKYDGHFVWVGSDGLGLNLDDFDGVENAVIGSLSLTTDVGPSSKFFDHFETLKPQKDSHQWLKEMWSSLFDCTWSENNSTVNSCDRYNSLTEAKDYSKEITVSTIIDTVYIFALALHNFINETCPLGFNDVEELHKCREQRITYFDFLKNTTLQRDWGTIRFDGSGDVMGKYQVLNFQSATNNTYVGKRVGVWDSSTLKLALNDTELKWHSKSIEGIRETPISRCGALCEAGEVYNYYRDTCCWECRKCEPNEIVLDNNTRCADCPKNYWPEQKNFSVCTKLVPVEIAWSHPIILLFITATCLGMISCLLVFVCFISHNNHRLIKATSRELSYIMLSGITIQYLLPLSIVSTPGYITCRLSYIGFNVSFAVVYAPLLTRTIRIYRIFRAGRHSVSKPTMTSPLSQVLIAVFIISTQVVTNAVSVMWVPPEVELRMPKETVPLVEETCTFHFHGFVASLCYNLFLVFICSFYAFKTRRLPDNFNESRYIALSVYTTLVIWTVFLPSYFVNNRAFHQVILLCSATLLNGTVNLMCLYIPKIYATLRSVDDQNIKFSYRTPSTNSHELHKCIGKSYKCDIPKVNSDCILHNSHSKPSLDGSTRRQSITDSDECPSLKEITA